MRLLLDTAPLVEPVTLAEAKAHCRVDDDITDDDSLMTAFIIAARNLCENICYRAFINQTWKVVFDLSDWPTEKDYITLPFGNVQSITSITSYSADNVASVLSTVNYRLSTDRAVINQGYSWPTLDRTYDTLEIVYVVGFGATAASVPQDIKTAIMMCVAHFYENREALIDPVTGNMQQQVLLPLGVSALLQPHRTFFI